MAMASTKSAGFSPLSIEFIILCTKTTQFHKVHPPHTLHKPWDKSYPQWWQFHGE